MKFNRGVCWDTRHRAASGRDRGSKYLALWQSRKASISLSSRGPYRRQSPSLNVGTASLQEAEKDTGVRKLRNVGQSFQYLSTNSVSVFLRLFLFPLCSLVLDIKGLFAHIYILGIKRPQRGGSSSREIMDGTVIKGVRDGDIDGQAGALVLTSWSLVLTEPYRTWLPSVVKCPEGTQEPVSL